MHDRERRLGEVGGALLAGWLRRERGLPAGLIAVEPGDDTCTMARVRLADSEALVAVVPLFDWAADAETAAQRDALEARLAEHGLTDVVLWTPPGASLAWEDGEDRLARIVEAGHALAPGERGEVSFPVVLPLRKTGTEGSYMQVVGGLSHLWARFTTQVMGQYALDSRAIARLPDDPERVQQLVDFLVLTANGVRSAGQSREVRDKDTWTLQRLPGLSGPAVVVADPSRPAADGVAVRKRVRASTHAARTLRDHAAAARAIVFLGVFRALAEETASHALRGMDFTALAPLDLTAIAADGRVKALMGPRPRGPLAGSPRTARGAVT